MKHIFELADTSDDEGYQTIAVFSTLEKARAVIDEANEKGEHVTPTGEHEDTETVSIFKREINSFRDREVVLSVDRECVYSPDGFWCKCDE